MIHVTQEGFKRIEWNGDIREYEERPWGDPVAALREGVEIIGTVTLGDVIRITANNEFLKMFIGSYSWCNVQAFYDELCANPAKAIGPEDEVQWCCVSMSVEVDHREPGKYEALPDHALSCGMDVHGKGSKDDTSWALDLSPLAEISGLPVRIQNCSLVTLIDARTGEYVTQREENLDYNPSLLEFLDAIFYEISFHGSPKQRDDKMLELNDMVKSITDGTAKLTPLDFDEAGN